MRCVLGSKAAVILQDIPSDDSDADGSTNVGIYILQTLRALVAQWVVHPTHTWLVPGSKHDWCKNPLVFAMIAG